MRIVENVNVGRADVELTTPSHVRGVHEGNRPIGGGKWARRWRQARGRAVPTTTSARSTGIDPERHAPIDPRMPNLSPA